MKQFDYVVIGGGSSGCVVASRLSERPDRSVLLLEAGRSGRNPFIAMPLAWGIQRRKQWFDHAYVTEPEPGAHNASLPAPAGRVLGGGSSINGMIYSRGKRGDYDSYASLGVPGWSYADVLPFFLRSENSWRGPSRWHGTDGPLETSPAKSDHLTDAIIRSGKLLGLPHTDDFNGPEPIGIGLPDLTITRSGRRADTASSFIRSLKRRPNLTVVTSAQVTKIDVEGNRASGVQYRHEGRAKTARANHEVVLSAGAYGSPQLLMLSGIGPPDELREMRINVTLDLPQVGRNLRDHPSVSLYYAGRSSFDFGEKLRLDRTVVAALRWLFRGEDFLGTLPLSAMIFHCSDPTLDQPDLENFFVPADQANAHLWISRVRPRAPDVLQVANTLLTPQSVGWVKLRSNRPADSPRIFDNILGETADVSRLLKNVRTMRELLRQAPLDDFLGTELMPGPNVESDHDMESWLRSNVRTAYHPIGTCRMGKEGSGVVDAQLRVHGIQGLRIADCSVLPAPVRGHSNMPAVMVGERAADFIHTAA